MLVPDIAAKIMKQNNAAKIWDNAIPSNFIVAYMKHRQCSCLIL